MLVVQMPSDPTVGRFYIALLVALGAPIRPTRPRLDHLEQLVLGLLRFLGNELRIPLVGVGTRDAYLAIRSDDQLEHRFQPFALSRWEPGEDACSLLASFAASFPLRRASVIATSEMAGYLLARSEGTIGELAHLLTDAVVAAIESSEEAINQRTLLLAVDQGPAERRLLFERELA